MIDDCDWNRMKTGRIQSLLPQTLAGLLKYLVRGIYLGTYDSGNLILGYYYSEEYYALQVE